MAKRVCELTGCSRREADEWLENGWIRVDGVVVDRLGARVSPKARIEIAEAAKRHAAAGVTIVYHQPDTTVAADPQVAPLLVSSNRWASDPPGRPMPVSLLRKLSPVARLAADESGMQVFTDQGSIARRLTDARIESEFHVRTDRSPTLEEIGRLRNGLRVGGVRLKCEQVSLSSDRLLRMVLREFRAGKIVEMCQQLGLQALAIKRVRIGSVTLGKLPVGQWRSLRSDERF
ncbi:MAG TPA: RNA pseudouridine synthase [Accumulibacter sp.]|nr:RNA pseudouridine synthase [Accumulibacter sp.]HNE12151.1 RNA pseudouridine synthase [Accumulibacter sp.]HNK00162.1 RNA pseudouridine synthase [Accumulibacter sp.]HNM74347.1 RNA pseudouridine synthase [Accumulibacter sp.]